MGLLSKHNHLIQLVASPLRANLICYTLSRGGRYLLDPTNIHSESTTQGARTEKGDSISNDKFSACVETEELEKEKRGGTAEEIFDSAYLHHGNMRVSQILSIDTPAVRHIAINSNNWPSPGVQKLTKAKAKVDQCLSS